MISSKELNRTQMYLGKPFQLTDKITILQPTIFDIIDYGDEEFYSMLYVLIGNTSMFKLQLWESRMDWNKVSDYELFINSVQHFTPEITGILFGDLDFSKFSPISVERDNSKYQEDNDEPETIQVLSFYNPIDDIEISEEIYETMVLYLRTMFDFFPKVDKAVDNTTKRWLIQEEMTNRELEKRKPKRSLSILPLISGCINHPGFKYKKNELKEVNVMEFFDSVNRLRIYEQTRALLNGSYSGFADLSKVPKDNFDFMRDYNPMNLTEDRSINNDSQKIEKLKVDDGTMKEKTSFNDIK